MSWLLIIPVVLYSLIILLLWFVLKKKCLVTLPERMPSAKVSVIISCRNEEASITALLKSLVCQDYPVDLLEITVVNDNSSDRTPIIVSEFISEHRKKSPLSIRLIYNPHAGKKSAIRYGVEKSSGEFILTTDADCTVSPGWVSAYACFYEATGSDMILSGVYESGSTGFVPRFGICEFDALQGVTEATARAGFPVMCNGANMGFRRDTYLKHSGKLHDDIPSGDDMFLLHSVRRAGGRISYLSDRAAAVNTAAAASVAALLRQRVRWASKAGRYRDPATLALAATTAACHAAVTAAAATSLFVPSFMPVLAATLALRIIPDYLVTAHTMKKREEHLPLIPFVIMDLIYPFWFITVGILALFPHMREFGRRTNISYPPPVP
jgi:cellulose synthase/poly-beta-1,6-N-acetylglucosamine synthase-like glycosyltransferase